MDEPRTVSRYEGWPRKKLVAELQRLQTRRDRLVLAPRVRAEEDEQIAELIELLRSR
jgi:hypothetical protein